MTDRPYWDAFYGAAHPDLQAPSTFATWCLPMFPPHARLIEFGCGNGRDALFFAQSGNDVIACDQSSVAIEALVARQNKELRENNPRLNIWGFGPPSAPFAPNPIFVHGDFTRLEDGRFGSIDVVYSRFTLHAITKAEASMALAWAAKNLRPEGLLAVEVRSVQGDLYGKGEPRERDAFVYNGHYRRFVRLDELRAELSALGFVVQQAIESAGLAVHNNDDPVVIRVIASIRDQR